MLAKTRQTWKLDGMNSLEYELISREHLPLYTNITVNIGTEEGLHPTRKPPKQQKPQQKPVADDSEDPEEELTDLQSNL